jgi:saccharopine dehydrogenase (NAD+, L-lysine forming)
MDAMPSTHFWIRHETRATERRAPVVPADVLRLLDEGFRVTVEDSPQRIVPTEDYHSAGAEIAPADSWVDAPDDAVIVGIKELPDEPRGLRHTHVYFAHAFKGQSDAVETLGRFEAGGGRLFDIEYLIDEQARRVVAFGYWAGYVGAALGVLHLAGTLKAPLTHLQKADLDEQLRDAHAAVADTEILVTGARGRSGRGARAALAVTQHEPTRWDRAEAIERDMDELFAHDYLVNCVGIKVPTSPFVTPEDLDRDRRMHLISDVTCDVTSDTNMLPVNTDITSWDEPVRRLSGTAGPLDVIAIDNLPSLLPLEASETFSADLTTQLLNLVDTDEPTGPWAAAGWSFERAMHQLTQG